MFLARFASNGLDGKEFKIISIRRKWNLMQLCVLTGTGEGTKVKRRFVSPFECCKIDTFARTSWETMFNVSFVDIINILYVCYVF